MEYVNPVKIGSKTYEMENATDYLFTPALRIDGQFISVWCKRPSPRAAYWLVRNGFHVPYKSRVYYSESSIDSLSLVEPLSLLGSPVMFAWDKYYLLLSDRIYVHSDDHEFALAQMIHF